MPIDKYQGPAVNCQNALFAGRNTPKGTNMLSAELVTDIVNACAELPGVKWATAEMKRQEDAKKAREASGKEALPNATIATGTPAEAEEPVTTRQMADEAADLVTKYRNEGGEMEFAEGYQLVTDHYQKGTPAHRLHSPGNKVKRGLYALQDSTKDIRQQVDSMESERYQRNAQERGPRVRAYATDHGVSWNEACAKLGFHPSLRDLK